MYYSRFAALRSRRILLVILLAVVILTPVLAVIISNVKKYNVTTQDVIIAVSPGEDSALPSGSWDRRSVTVSTPSPFTGYLLLTVRNTTTSAVTMNPSSFEVLIDGASSSPFAGGTSILFTSIPKTVADGTTFAYEVHYISRAEDAVNGIVSGTSYEVEVNVSGS